MGEWAGRQMIQGKGKGKGNIKDVSKVFSFKAWEDDAICQ